MKNIVVITVLLFTLIVSSVFAQSRISFEGGEIIPDPLHPVEIGGVGTLQFNWTELGGVNPIEATVFGGPNVTFSVQLSYIDLKQKDVDLITGTGLDYFTPVYEVFPGHVKVIFYQNKEIPAGASGAFEIPVSVTKNSVKRKPLNGFIGNIQARGDVDIVGGYVEAWTYTLCKPVLISVGDIACTATGYSVSFITDAVSIEVLEGVGTVNFEEGTITNIPFGEDITIVGTNETGCSDEVKINGPLSCPDTCEQPNLMVGQPICGPAGSSFYEVILSETTGATVTASAGTIAGNVLTVPSNIEEVIIKAVHGDCEQSVTVLAPTDCDAACAEAVFSVAGVACDTTMSGNYVIHFIRSDDVIVTTDKGVVDLVAGTITVPSLEGAVTITVREGRCLDHVLKVEAPDCVADIDIEKIATQISYTPGETVNYLIEVTNNGPLDASNIQVTDGFPVGITEMSWSASDGTFGTGSLNENISLIAGEIISYSVEVQVPSDFTGDLINVASAVDPDIPDPIPCTDCSETISSGGAIADIDVLKEAADNTTYTPGEDVTYTITVSNAGPSDASEVLVSDNFPSGITEMTWTGPG
ncbi:MAG: DUF11 domain-containing protein, partial [Flavobacteriaceae bacterium]|nr:DUF11 domain-containing protein [Flavobacteriaceae bacterium]